VFILQCREASQRWLVLPARKVLGAEHAAVDPDVFAEHDDARIVRYRRMLKAGVTITAHPATA
jgi:hypothetical protein